MVTRIIIPSSQHHRHSYNLRPQSPQPANHAASPSLSCFPSEASWFATLHHHYHASIFSICCFFLTFCLFFQCSYRFLVISNMSLSSAADYYSKESSSSCSSSACWRCVSMTSCSYFIEIKTVPHAACQGSHRRIEPYYFMIPDNGSVGWIRVRILDACIYPFIHSFIHSPPYILMAWIYYKIPQYIL